MKIAHIHLSDEFAGSEQYAASLAATQAKAGQDVCVVVRDGPHAPRWRTEAEPAAVLVVPGWVPSLLESWVILRLLRGFGPEIVHAHLGGANFKGGAVAHSLGVPWVATVHLRYKAKEMAKASGLICIAKWQEQDVEMEGYKGKVATVWNWLPHMPVPGEASLRKKLNIPAESFVVGSAGRLHRQKGMDVLIQAFRQAFFDDEDVRLLIAGQGEERLRLQGFAGNDRRIVFGGYMSKMDAFYQTCDVYVSASRYEPFGLTLVEAMAHQLPLVCTETEGPKEFLASQTEVTWVKNRDVAALAEALYASYTQGRRRVTYDMAPFAPERAAQEIETFYTTVLKNHRDKLV